MYLSWRMLALHATPWVQSPAPHKLGVVLQEDQKFFIRNPSSKTTWISEILSQKQKQ